MGTTRAYVSAVELGVPWDPDADKLVVWAQTLGWPEGYLLRALGRTIISATDPALLSADQMETIKRAVADGVRTGVREALRDKSDGGGDSGPAPAGPPPEPPPEPPP